jgi:hypothetical protein
MGLPCHYFASAYFRKFEIQKRFIICFECSTKCFHFVLFFVFVRALPPPTNSLNMIVDVVPVSSNALIGATVPSLFLLNYSHRNPPCAPPRTHGQIQAPREPPTYGVCSRVCTLSQYRTKLILLSHNFSNFMLK